MEKFIDKVKENSKFYSINFLNANKMPSSKNVIPFKAKAWMDLTDRKAAGEHVDSKNIKKHKNDVFRLTELIDPTAKVVAPQGVYADIQEFVQRMKNENVDIKQLGLVGRTKEKILEELKVMYETL